MRTDFEARLLASALTDAAVSMFMPRSFEHLTWRNSIFAELLKRRRAS